MRIILTVHHFPPNYSAGAEVYVFRLASWLVKHGHEVEVVCIESITHEGDSELEHKHEIYEGISVWRLYFNLEQAPDPFRLSFDNPTIGAWFVEFLQRMRPDVVHINSCYLLSVSTIAAAKQRALPLIVTLHDFWFMCPRITLLKPTGALCAIPKNVEECAWCLATERRRFRWPEMASHGLAGAVIRPLLALPVASKLLGIQSDVGEIAYRRELLINALEQADIILSPSEFLRSIFIEQGIEPAKILYSRLGLDTSHWIIPSEAGRELSEKMRISYIGQLAYHKGVHLLVTALNKLVFPNGRVLLTVYGDANAFPDYAQSLREIADGNPAIEFAGSFDNRRVAEILNNTDIIVAPSIWYENSPIAIIEALTTGTPVVTSNLGGMSELVQHNVNGLIFETGNSDDLAGQLQRLIDEPALSATLASNAQPVRMINDEMAQIISLYEGIRRRSF